MLVTLWLAKDLANLCLTRRTCYIAIPLYVCGFVLMGASFQNRLSVGALVMGWGIAEVAIVINTVAVCECLGVHAVLSKSLNSDLDAYCNDCFPQLQVSYVLLILP
jgi:hypothetical protein